MEGVLRKAKVHRNGVILQKCPVSWHIDTVGRTKRDVTSAFSPIEPKSTKMGLAINEGKTKYMLSTSRDDYRIESQITVDNYTFDIVKEFIYLSSAVTTKYDVRLEI